MILWLLYMLHIRKIHKIQLKIILHLLNDHGKIMLGALACIYHVTVYVFALYLGALTSVSIDCLEASKTQRRSQSFMKSFQTQDISKCQQYILWEIKVWVYLIWCNNRKIFGKSKFKWQTPIIKMRLPNKIKGPSLKSHFTPLLCFWHFWSSFFQNVLQPRNKPYTFVLRKVWYVDPFELNCNWLAICPGCSLWPEMLGKAPALPRHCRRKKEWIWGSDSEFFTCEMCVLKS